MSRRRDGARRPAPPRRAAERVRAWLPLGNMPRPATWAHRHRATTRFALLQSACLGVLALVLGRGPGGAALAVAVTGVPALVAAWSGVSWMAGMLTAVVSLMFASATLVDLTNGLTEAHFHFFVMLGIVSLYQDWAAFGMCVLITVLHHAVMGTMMPSSVFSSAAQRHDPVRWAVVHGGFILAASITHMIAWKVNEEQGLRDPLTLLPHRSAFVDRLATRLREGRAEVSVLFVDIDNFTSINDSGGHHVGDDALCHTAQQMTLALGPHDHVARIGGDEFAVLVDGGAARGREVAERITESLRSPAVVHGREVFVTVSIGVADSTVATAPGPEDLLRDADLAMYVATSSGKNRVVTYTTGVARTVRDRTALAQDLRDALELGQFEIHYQPVIAVEDGTMCGVEALIRRQHPERGLVAPCDFIPLAEESGDIRPIGAWVLRTAAAPVADWHRTVPGCKRLDLAVNLSPAQLRDPQLLSDVGDALHRSGLADGCLTLEVTESMLLSDLELAERQLDAVRLLGARVALDDFGTGYSSLSYLARLPADQVKIDRSFLTELGCPRSQGYLHSRPLTAPGLEAFAWAADRERSVLATAQRRRAS